MSRWFQTALCGLVLSLPARAANPPPTQVFYVPFPEDHQLTAFDSVNGVANAPINVFVTFSAATDGTVIYYDHWEDGYERDITNPVQSTTRIFGDGNPANGSPPGNASDLVSAGTVFNLRNNVDPATLQAVVDYDARDKIASFKPISVTKLAFPDGTDTLLAGCVEVFERGIWGTEYRSPVGVDMPQSTASGNLTFDENVFSYTALAISAGVGGASVQIDKDNNGTFEETVVLAEGEVVYRDAVNVGGRVLADKPVQVILFTGTVGSNYASRDTSLLPVNRWSSDYFAPVSTVLTEGTVTFLYNPSASPITVNYDYRSSSTAYTTASISVPAGGNTRVVLTPSNGTSHFGAYRFYTTGGPPATFYAISAIDADAASGSNQNWDGGFTLVGKPSLTTQVLLSLGIGRDPYSAVNPGQNGNPVWITTSGNGHIQEAVYVDYNGDNSGPLTDANGNFYDISYNLRELEQLKIYDPDGDQTGMLVYTLNPSVRIAAVWGQDPAVASVAQPGLDVASLVPPLREGDAGKISSLAVDTDGDGYVSAGDTLEYDIRALSNARATIPGPFGVIDNLPVDTTYVANSTRYRYSVGGVWQPWVSVADNGFGTPFPLDGSGLSVPGSLPVGQQLQVTFRAAVDTYANLSGGTIVNTGNVEISPYGLVLPVNWTDTLYGSIGDRVWIDLDGDGVQDGGEGGITGITVYADLNNNSVRDSGEPSDTTDSNGNYLLPGLVAGNYTVRVDPANIAAANVGYGPTYDLDGIATSHVANVTLLSAQDRVDADFGYRVGASIGDRVWVDRDADGVQEPGEPGINGVRVYIDANNNNAYDSGERNTITSGDGTYYIGNLSAGSYNVRVDTATLPTGTTQTFDLNGGLDHEAAVTLTGAEHRGDLDFGYRGNLSIGDLVWEDLDANGTRTVFNVIDGRIDINNDAAVNGSDDGFIGLIQIINGRVDLDGSTVIDAADAGTFQGIAVINGNLDVNGVGGITTDDDATGAVSDEAGIAGIRVYIDADGDGVFDSNEASAITSGRGLYSIGNLFDGTYTVRVDTTSLPASYAQTYDLVNPSTDHTAVVALSGASRSDVDFGYRNDASLGDLVWNDRDADGVRDAGEPGIEGVLVYLDADNDNLFDQGVERFAITDVNGSYLIANLSSGSYNVRIEISTLPQGVTQTYDLTSGTLDNEAARTLTGTENATDVDFGYRATASFGDFVWNDSDADGVQDGGEPGIAGVRVYLDMNGNNIFESASEPSATTDSAGAYTIGNLVPGTYTAKVDTSTLTAGFLQTYDATGSLDHAATFSLSASQTRADIDFGYTAPVSIGNFVWHDQDGDGQQDGGEPGLAGVVVTAHNAANDAVVGTFTTLTDGAYSFTGLSPGSYYVIFGTLSGYQRTLLDQGADTTDSDANRTTGRTPSVSLTGGQSNLTLDAGYFQLGTITGTVFADTNNDNTGDVPINSVTLTLKDSSGNDIDSDPNTAGVQPTVTTTNASGVYTFSNLPPGSYRVVETQPSGYLSVSDVDGLNNNVIGDQTPIVLASGQTRNGNNFIEEQPGSISGTVFADTNNDNVGDVGIASVTLTLYTDPNGDGNRTDGLAFGSPAVTIAGGTYSFTNLPPGAYVVEETQPSGYLTVTDVDATTPGDDASNSSTTDNAIPVAVTANETDTGNNFIEEQPGLISGTVFADTNNDNIGDVGITGVTLTLYTDPNGDGNRSDGVAFGSPAVTIAGGTYSFTNLPPGAYVVEETQPSGYLTVTDVDATTPGDDASNASTTDNAIPVAVTANETDTGNNFIEEQPGTISGTVFRDTDNNGSGDAPLAGVTLTLLDGSGNPIDGDPNTAGVQPLVRITDSSGNYLFDVLPPGIYQVSETQPAGYASVSDVDGGNPDRIGNIVPINVAAAQNVTGRNFVEVQLGSISGFVYVGATPLANVILTLLDENGDSVDGDPNTPGVQPITTVTDSNGHYTFTGVIPGNYQIAQTQPFGYNSFGDIDGGDIDIIGDVSLVTVLPGQENANNNFVESLDTCPDTWAEWEFQHPSELPGGNPDADAYDNFAEFAFAMPYDAGTGSPWLGNTAWIIRPSTIAPGTLEGVFVRPKGAPQNVTYTLQYAAVLGNPTVWQSLIITPAMITTVDNGDCTETVTIHGLEALTGLTGGAGTVRIKAELDEVPPSGTDHTSYSETEGWKDTPLDLCCRTYSNPFLRESLFTGTITGVTGQTIDLSGSSGSQDLAFLLSGGSYYVEVTSGENEGQRFDVVSATTDSLVLAIDANLFEGTPPFSTLVGALPANLAGDSIVLRRHWTLGEIFPADGFGATDDRTTADQVQHFANGVWTFYWLYDDGVSAPIWVKTGDNTFADQGATVIPPGQGLFFNNRTALTSILAYGEVRPNNFIRPLSAGSNLIAGGYPLDQSATGLGSREMTSLAGFFGSRDIATADTFYIWRGDEIIGSSGYDSYFLNNNAPRLPSVIKWVKIGDATLAPYDTEVLLLGNRSVFLRSKNELPAYTVSSPWNP